MDAAALNAALAAITANMTALANQINAAPAAPVVQQGPAVLPLVALDPSIKYSGSSGESVADWLQLINRKAVLANWGGAERRLAAIGSLYGQALTWQEEIGVNIADWDDWVRGIRNAFELLSDDQWRTAVESRRQLPGETGTNYVLEKLKLCRMRSIPLTEPETIPYLIRGLNSTEQRTIMMGNPPQTIANFLAELRRLEAIGFVQLPPDPSPSSPNDPVLRALEALTVQVSMMARNASRAANPVPAPSAPVRPPYPAPPYVGNGQNALPSDGNFRRPPGSRNESQCYNCYEFGHYSRDCPHPNPRYPRPSENSPAGPSGQGRP